MKQFPAFLFFLLAALSLRADAMEAGNVTRNTNTVRTKEKIYRTDGRVVIPVSREKALQVMENTDNWHTWIFSGMDGREKIDHFLLVYITDIQITEPDALSVMVEFRFLRNLGKKGERIPFTLLWNYGTEGHLEKVTVILAEQNAILDSARYSISISGSQNQVVIDYNAEVRLTGFFEFMVSLRSYRKTIEWYLDRIIDNYISELLP